MPNFEVMTWNVENLFRPAAGAAPPEQQRFQQKLNLIAGVINQQAPDSVALPEIGGQEPLLDLQQALGGTYPPRAVSAFPDVRGIRIAFLSTLPVGDPLDIVDFLPAPALAINDLTASGGSKPIT